MTKKKKKLNFRSKKGVTLLELVIGIAIVVIIFASTLGAMVGGYTTTLRNADQTKVASLNAALNEVIIYTLENKQVAAESDVTDLVTMGSTQSPLKGALEGIFTDAANRPKYVEPASYPITNTNNPNYADYQFTLVTTQSTSIDRTLLGAATPSLELKGVYIKTCFQSASGPINYESFVPYKRS